MKKRLLALCLVLCMVLGMLPVTAFAASTSVTMTASELGLENADDFESWTSAPVTITAGVGTNSWGNTPKYYTSGSAVRMYVDNKLSVSVADGYVLESVVITAESSKYVLKGSVTGASLSTDGAVVTLLAEANTTQIDVVPSATTRITTIVVTYTVAGGLVCQHENTTVTTVAAGCNTEGSETTTCDDCGKTIKIENLPVAGHTYDGEASCSVCGAVAYHMVTDASQLKNGATIVIAAAGFDYALSTKQNSNNRGQANVTKNSDDTVLFSDDVQLITLEKDTATGLWAFNTGSGYLFAASSSSNHLKTQTTNDANGLWKITIADGVTSIVAVNSTNRNILRYNDASALFSCYASGQQDLVLYANELGAACAHENTNTDYTDATCTEDGSRVVTCTDCGNIISNIVISSPGHNYVVEGSAVSCSSCSLTGTVVSLEKADEMAQEAGDSYTADVVYVTGVITEIDGNNMTIADADGNTLYIYRVYDAAGTQYSNMITKPLVDDTVVLEGVVGTYKSNSQMKNATIVSYTHEHTYTNGQCVCGAYAPGTEQNPIVLTELENTVENSGTVYYQCYFSGTHMSINSNDGEYKVTIDGTTEDSWWGMFDTDVVTPNPRMPFNFSIEGEGTLQINFEYPEGSMMNPADLYMGYNYATIEAGNDQGYLYNWTAPADGTLTLNFSAMDSNGEECGWFYVVNNMTTYAYGESQWSDSDPVVNPAVITVKAGDEIELRVNSYDPNNEWNNPAADVITKASFVCDVHGDCEYEDNNDNATHDYVCTVCGTVLIDDEDHDFGEGACVCGAEKSGSENNPIWLYEQENTVENEDKLFYQGYFSNMTMTVLGEGDFKVEYNGQTFNSENGKISIPVSSPNPRMPVIFALEGNGTYQINFSFPAGHMENPAELNVGTVAAPGENTAAVPGNGTPYFYAWTAPMDGTLTINMVSGNFVISIDNMTTGAYGDMQFASDGVTTFTVELNAGDEIRVTVGTEDYTTADVKLTAAFEEKGVGFAGMTMSLGNSLAVNFVIDTALLEGDGHVAVITKTYADGTEPMSVRIPQADWAVYSGTMRYFTFTGVKAKEMTDEFTVVIYNAAGEQVSKTYTRTIAEYCVGQIERYEQDANPDAERLALYVDILKYGAAAQNYFSYNVNNLATANLSAAQLAYGTQNAEVTDIRVKGTGYMGSTLLLQNEILLNFVFTNATANKAAYAMVTYDHYDGTSGTVKIMAADFQAYGTTGKYVTVPGLKMADYQQVVTLTLHDANGNVLSTSQDSVASYVARMSDADPVYDAVVKLGKSSLAYFK